MKEEALLLGPHKSLIGVYCTPSDQKTQQKNDDLAVIFLNAGLIHHVGPHRLHVKLARKLAKLGISSLRVDFSGLGDSSANSDNIPAHELIKLEIKQILAELSSRGYENFVLFGICSGAAHALQGGNGDRRIKGLVLINIGAGTTTNNDAEKNVDLAATFYLKHSLRNYQAWKNLLMGRVNLINLFMVFYTKIATTLRPGNRKKIDIVDSVRQSLEPTLSNDSQFLIILSDRHAQIVKYLGDGLQEIQRSGQIQIKSFPEADHLFTELEDQETLTSQVCEWIKMLQQEILHKTRSRINKN